MAHSTTTQSTYPLTPTQTPPSEPSLLATAAHQAAASSSKPFALTIRTSDLATTPAPPPSPVDFGWESANSSAGVDYFAQALGGGAKWRARSYSGATPVSAS